MANDALAQKAQNFTNRGRQAMEGRKFDLAVEMFLQALTFVPDALETRRMLRAAQIAKFKSNPPSALALKMQGMGSYFARQKVLGLAKKGQGVEAMAELPPFMSDPDQDVADAASSRWKDALQEIDDDGVKAGVIEMSAMAIKDKDMLEDVANELVGIDELAAIQVIVNVIETGGAAADAVREVYDLITGEEWSDIDAAESWLQENYDSSEQDDEGGG